MKIIFLDMDGVLCTSRSHVASGKKGLMQALDPVGIGLLNQIADDDTFYVLSSTWRFHFDREEMISKLREHGWTGRFHDHWCTVGRFSSARGQEIGDWLNDHNHRDRPYVIIDDTRHGMGPDLLAHLVQTKFDDGISFEDFNKARTILLGVKEPLIVLG